MIIIIIMMMMMKEKSDYAKAGLIKSKSSNNLIWMYKSTS